MLHLLLTHSGPVSGTGKDDLEHISTVGAYIHYGAGAAMSDPRAVDLSRVVRGKGVGDPLYASVSTKV